MKNLLGLLMVSALGFGSGCAPAVQKMRSQEALVHVDSDPGVPLANVAVSFDGKVLTHTANDGAARLRMTGHEGDIFHVGVACPAGYEAVTSLEFDVVVRREEAGRAPEFAARCTRTVRRVAVTVRAVNGPRLPVMYLGREVGRTDASGVATVTMDVQPGTDIELVLDTHGVKRIHPTNPTLSFKATNRDDAVMLDQRFTVDRAPVVRVVARGPVIAKQVGGS